MKKILPCLRSFYVLVYHFFSAIVVVMVLVDHVISVIVMIIIISSVAVFTVIIICILIDTHRDRSIVRWIYI